MRYSLPRVTLLTLVSVTALVLTFLAPVRAHDALPTAAQPNGWTYGWECCHSLDCKQISSDAVETTSDGYLLKPRGEVLAYSDKRLKFSQDEEYHLCTEGGKSDGKLICLYRPRLGF